MFATAGMALAVRSDLEHHSLGVDINSSPGAAKPSNRFIVKMISSKVLVEGCHDGYVSTSLAPAISQIGGFE